MTTLVFIFCWLAFLTCRSFQLEASPVLTADVMRQLISNQEVRGRRQLSSGKTILEGDIVVREGDYTGGSPSALDAPLANPDRLWPSGLVEYKFYDTFPTDKKQIMLNAMEYITRKVPCIKFQEATELTKDYVLIRDTAGVCRSDLGRIGGKQEIELNSGCFQSGLMTPVHELLHTLGSKNGEDVITFLHGQPDYTWPEPQPDDPLSIIDQVELAMAYSCEVSQEKLLQYIHFNRLENRMLIDQQRKDIDQLKKEIDTHHPVKVLVRKEVGNPADYFDKTYAEYQAGFSANGESWLGLENLHRLTSQQDYKLKIILTDFDGQKYDAIYDRFKVGPAADGYPLTVGGFNDALSTLGDSMTYNNGMKFSTKDRDQDKWTNHCAQKKTGGWWYNDCTEAHLTGMHTETKSTIVGLKQIFYYYGGERGDTDFDSWAGRGNGYDSWAEVKMLLLPN